MALRLRTPMVICCFLVALGDESLSVGGDRTPHHGRRLTKRCASSKKALNQSPIHAPLIVRMHEKKSDDHRQRRRLRAAGLTRNLCGRPAADVPSKDG